MHLPSTPRCQDVAVSINGEDTELGAFVAYVDERGMHVIREGEVPFSTYPDGPHFNIQGIDIAALTPRSTIATPFKISIQEQDIGYIDMMATIAARDFGVWRRRITNIAIKVYSNTSDINMQISGKASKVTSSSMEMTCPSIKHGTAELSFDLLVIIPWQNTKTFFKYVPTPSTWAMRDA